MKNNGTTNPAREQHEARSSQQKWSTPLVENTSNQCGKIAGDDHRTFTKYLLDPITSLARISLSSRHGMMVLVSVNHIFCLNGASRQHKACFRLPARKYCLAQASFHIYGWMPREIQQPYSLKACHWKWLPTPATFQGWIYYSTSGGGKHCIVLWRYNLNSYFPSRLGCRDSKSKDWSHKVRSSQHKPEGSTKLNFELLLSNMHMYKYQIIILLCIPWWIFFLFQRFAFLLARWGP